MRLLQKSIITCTSGMAIATATAAGAQETPEDFLTYRPKAEAVRISEEEAPKIDGDLSDLAWQKAVPFENFFEVDPEEGTPPGERTVVRVLYDRENLYISIYAYDKTPEDIKASIMVRDQGVSPDDNVSLVLDPSNTRRDGYLFEVNPNGARVEGLIENNSNVRIQWDTLWQARARTVEDGWTSEFAIPFRSINYDPEADSWGFQILRRIREENEAVRWANIDISKPGIDLTRIGELSGISDVASGRGIEAQIFGTSQFSYDWERPRDTDLTFEPSGNVYYKITPSLTGTLTANTDFSDTPLDSRQVNTGRFSLFFPETRDFFLQDAAVFEFGGKIFNNPNGLPFFSRNIGIVRGRPTDIMVGGKLSGLIGETSVGALVTQTADVDVFEGQTLSSLRVSQPIFRESKVGLVYTNGDPTGATNNNVGGVDFQYKNSELPRNATFTADFAYVRSEEDGSTETTDTSGATILQPFDRSGDLYASEIAYRSQTWNATLRYRNIDGNYNPRLGFTNRNDIENVQVNLFRQFRPNTERVRFIETGAFAFQTTDKGQIDRNGNSEDEGFGYFFFGLSPQGDELFGEFISQNTSFTEGFNLAGRVPVDPGSYDFNTVNLNIESGSVRKVSAGLFTRYSNIYDGTQWQFSPELTWRPNKYFAIETNYTWQNFDLPNGDLTIHIGSIESDINFSPDMSLSTEIQYDNISENFTMFSRFRWEPQPETEIFVSLGHSATIEELNFPDKFTSLGTSMSFRIGQTIRF